MKNRALMVATLLASFHGFAGEPQPLLSKMESDGLARERGDRYCAIYRDKVVNDDSRYGGDVIRETIHRERKLTLPADIDQQIQDASQGKIVKGEPNPTDIPTKQYTAYLQTTPSGPVKQVVLSQTGMMDGDQENQSEAAAGLKAFVDQACAYPARAPGPYLNQ